MKLVKQRQKTDCGIACIATLCSTSYEETLATAIIYDMFRTDFADLPETFRRLGFASKIHAEFPTEPRRNGMLEITFERDGVIHPHYLVYDATEKKFLHPGHQPLPEFQKLRFIEIWPDKN